MVLVKVLKRKDASSLLVAIPLAVITLNFVNAWAMAISDKLVEWGKTSLNFRHDFLLTLVTGLVAVIVLEIVARVFIWLRQAYVDR